MRTLLRLAVVLLLGVAAVAAGCRRAESPPARPGRTGAPQRSVLQPPPPAEERRLAAAPGTVLEIRVAGARTLTYRIDLPAGRYAAIRVDQRGADVVVVLRSPDGRQLRRVDGLSGPWGPEPLPFIAEQAGSYRIDVRSPDGEAGGSYRIAVEAVRAPTPRDRGLVAAEAAFAAGEERRRQGGRQALLAAVERDRRALELFRANAAAEREADVLFALGETYGSLGAVREARQSYARSLEMYRGAGRKRDSLLVLPRLGRTDRILGEPGQALQCYREALALSRELRDRRQEVTTLGNLGRLYASLGELETAHRFYDEALAGWRELGVADDEAATLNNLGQLYIQLGEARQAIDYFKDALSVLEAAGEGPATGVVLQSLGSAYVNLGEPGQGLGYLHRALELHRESGNRRDEAVVLNELGWVHWQAGGLAEARRYYRLALDLDRATGNRKDEAIVLHNLAWVEDALGDPAAAARSFEQALSRFTAAGDRGGEAKTWYGLALARRHAGDLKAARAAIEAALEQIESLRLEPAEGEMRASYFATKQQYFAFYIDLLMELHRRDPAAGHDAEAFEASERARARSLLEDLAEAGGARGHGGLAEDEADLARRLDTLELRRLALARAAAPAAGLEGVERELRRVLAWHRRARAAIRRAGRSGPAVSQAEPLRLAEIQRRVLDGDTVLLEYYLGQDRSFLWVVTPTALESFELPGRDAIEAAARKAYELLLQSRRRTARARTELALQDLSRLLLAPVGDRLARRRTLVVADGVLHYIPFAALPVPRPGAGRDVGGRVPLVVDHDVVTLPSASTAAALRRRRLGRSRAPATVAVLADPVFDPRDDRVEGVLPAATKAGSSLAARAPARGPSAVRFPRLRASRLEADAILSLVPAGRRLELLGFEASRDKALSGVLARYRYVHFATHGSLDTVYPELSGLVLSLVDRRGRPTNGFLRAYEIADLHLAADLVVLSACRTALGKEIRGEGLVGLSRAFLDAGADGVLVSLWQVEDRATAKLMETLYRGMLREGLSPAAALRRAQLSLLQGRDWRAPYYWAGFALQGEWR